MATHTFSLRIDGCPTHVTSKVAEACGRASMGIVFVPRTMSGILQPLDVYVFQRVKAAAQEALEILRESPLADGVHFHDIISLSGRCKLLGFSGI